MIIVRTIMNVLPDKSKELMQTLLSMIEVVGKENGCLNYDVFQDIELNTIFNLIEEWKTREDLEAHIQAEKFGVLLGTKSLLAKPLEMKIHTISSSEGIEAVNTIRNRGVKIK
jgi:quinol monooxygenase YgiN